MSAAAGSVASRNLCPCFLPNAIQRLVEGICTAPEPLAFFVRHVRLEHLDHAAAADDARQGQRDSKLLLIAADRNDRSSLSTISAIRADTMPIPYWLASWPSMMLMLA